MDLLLLGAVMAIEKNLPWGKSFRPYVPSAVRRLAFEVEPHSGRRTMAHHREAFVAFDTAKLRNAVAVADAGRNGEIRYLGEIDNTEAATRKLVAQLASKYSHLTFCYEAGPTGYGLYRLPSAAASAPDLIEQPSPWRT